MKWYEFFKEHLLLLISYFFMVLLFGIFFIALRIEIAFIILYFVLFLFFFLFWFGFYGYRKKKFYDSFSETLDSMDLKYLIHEMEIDGNFLEARKMLEFLYDIDKSMKEEITSLTQKNQDFRNYIEMWIHEIKIPLSNLVLLFHNKEEDESKYTSQITRIEEYIEQVLYYVRSEMVEKDYLIKTHDLKKIVSEVVKRNKDAFIYGGISLDIQVQGNVLTDDKWLKFILNQILSNSLKYKREENAQIVIRTEVIGTQTFLKIRDNGIGILDSDLPRVFEKSFTGVNGRNLGSSTGMGLFICKGLIEKLGHQIKIHSKVNEFTEVTIVFSHTDFYEVV